MKELKNRLNNKEFFLSFLLILMPPRKKKSSGRKRKSSSSKKRSSGGKRPASAYAKFVKKYYKDHTFPKHKPISERSAIIARAWHKHNI